MKKKFTYLLFLTLLFLSSETVFSQINTPAGANWPFGARIQQFAAPYPYGIVPGNLPGGAYTPASNLYGKSQDAYTAYVAWRANYVVNCGGSPVSMRIKFDDPNQTVSEGIGYGMLLAAYAADKALFDGLWTYYRNNITYGQYGDVMGWSRNGCANGGTGAGSENGATDSELDAAMALIVAECQWPTAITPYDYGAQATTLIRQIRLWEITNASCGTANQLSNGDGFVVGNSTCRNPSYQAPAYVKMFQAYDPTAPANYWTTTVYNTIYPLLNANNNNTTGLVSNWCDNTGTPNSCNSPAFNDYGYDAARYPWRIATDYLWHGDASALANCIPITDVFIPTTRGAILGNAASYANVKGPVTLAGANIGGRTTPAENSIFTSTWAVGCMGVTATANRQSRLNDMYSRTVAVQEAYSATQPTNYYGNTLRTLMLFELTGNFWKPCPPRCQNPAIANDTISLCSGTPNITLDAQLATASFRFFNWYKSPSATSLGTGNTLTTVSTTGKYYVVVDSINGAYSCSRADTVIVISTLPTPKLGPNRSVCSPTPAVLDANVSGSPAYTYQWAYSSSGLWSGLADITYLGTNKTYSAKSPGLYRVTVSSGLCATRFDTITVRSLLPTPVDGCISPGPGIVNLSITNAPGTAADYEWYAGPTVGSSLGTGTTFATGSLSTTTTYYVLDKTKQAGSVGLKVPTIPNYSTTACNAFTALANEPATGRAGVDNPQSYQNTFTTYVNNVYIDSITVFFCLYGPGAVTATFNLQTAAGGATAFTSGLQSVTPTLPGSWFNPPYNTSGRVTGVRFKVGINIATAGTYRMALATGGTGNAFIHQDAAVAYSYIDDIDGNTIRIENTFGYTTTYTMRYGPMYDWRILAPKTCDRLPVTAYVVPSGCGAILPVQLLSFKAKYVKTNVQLNWVSASESSNSHYIIERSSDNGTFTPIGKVKGAGSSSDALSYSFIDYQPLEGISYYRLVSVDFNGKKQYTATETITISLSDYVSVFPNPSSNSVSIKALDMGNKFNGISIYDLTGKLVLSSIENASEKTIDVSALPQGVYIIKVSFDESLENIRFIKN